MNVTLCSYFRDSAATIPRYFEQAGGLNDALIARGDKLDLVLGEGDSTDGATLPELLICAAPATFPVRLYDVSHGGPVFGSIEDPQRFLQLSLVANTLAEWIPRGADAVVWVESDLIWQPNTILALIDHLANVPAVAPMVLENTQAPRFYDVWAVRRNGVRFTKDPPFHPELNAALLQVDSAGSCLAVRGELARAVRFPREDVIVGYCRGIYEHGGTIYIDPGLAVWHP